MPVLDDPVGRRPDDWVHDHIWMNKDTRVMVVNKKSMMVIKGHDQELSSYEYKNLMKSLKTQLLTQYGVGQTGPTREGDGECPFAPQRARAQHDSMSTGLVRSIPQM